MHKDYIVVSHTNIDDFQEAVIYRLNDGWELAGGMCTGTHYNMFYFYQAMSKVYMPEE